MNYIGSVLRITFLFICCLSVNCHAQLLTDSITPGYDPYAGYAEEVYLDMDFDPNLATPIVTERSREGIRKYVRTVAESLKDQFIVDLMRDGEVMVLTIPSDMIFLPNDTLLSPGSTKILDKITPLLEDALMFKVLISMNVDDTGSPIYRERLALSRLNSVYDWIIKLIDKGKASEDLIVIPFSMADNDPMTDNLTRASRAENRRLEFYFVPGPKMISMAESGLL